LRDIGIDVWRLRPAPGRQTAGVNAASPLEESVPDESLRVDHALGETAPKESAPKESAPKESAPKESEPTESAPKKSGPRDEPIDVPSVDSPTPDTAEAAPSIRLRFGYARLGPGACLYDETLANIHQQFVRDLLSACEALRSETGSGSEGPRFSLGEFRWPILDSGGSPERALAAFFDKQSEGATDRWMLITERVLEDIQDLIDTEAQIVVIPPISELAGNATLKRELWERLKQVLG
jgi:hypothetical protein